MSRVIIFTTILPLLIIIIIISLISLPYKKFLSQVTSSLESFNLSSSSSSSATSLSSEIELDSSAIVLSSTSVIASSSYPSTTYRSSSPFSTLSVTDAYHVECYNCEAKEFKEYLCDIKKFVMVVNITSDKQLDESFIKYNINIVKIYKRSPLFIVVYRRPSISLSRDDPHCRWSTLAFNRSYLITGSVYGLNVLISKCDLILDWDPLPVHLKKQVNLIPRSLCPIPMLSSYH